MATFFDLPLEVRDMIYEYYVFAVIDSARDTKTCFSPLNGEAGLFMGEPSRMAIEAFPTAKRVLERRHRGLRSQMMQNVEDEKVLKVIWRKVYRERGSQSGAYIACQRIWEDGLAWCSDLGSESSLLELSLARIKNLRHFMLRKLK